MWYILSITDNYHVIHLDFITYISMWFILSPSKWLNSNFDNMEDSQIFLWKSTNSTFLQSD
jgi:hypothetical protein